MLPRILLFCSCLLLIAGTACAAEIHGQLWVEPNNSPPIGATFSTSCGGGAQVDQYGRYRITGLPLHTSCALTVSYNNMTSNPSQIYTADNRNNANFKLKTSDGRLLLIRR
jgi:hypothetical protein